MNGNASPSLLGSFESCARAPGSGLRARSGADPIQIETKDKRRCARASHVRYLRLRQKVSESSCGAGSGEGFVGLRLRRAVWCLACLGQGGHGACDVAADMAAIHMARR